jgi:two-component system sensor histidine kinase QseC
MNSIRVSLVMMLVAAFTLVSFLASLNGYRASMAEAEKLLDSQLRYASEILLVTGIESAISVSRGEVSDDEFAFQVWREGQLVLRSSGAPNEPIN